MKLLSFDPPYQLSRYASAMPRTLQPGEDPTPHAPKVVVEFTRAEFGELVADMWATYQEMKQMGFESHFAKQVFEMADEAGFEFRYEIPAL